jgi:hypothetical protein
MFHMIYRISAQKQSDVALLAISVHYRYVKNEMRN